MRKIKNKNISLKQLQKDLKTVTGGKRNLRFGNNDPFAFLNDPKFKKEQMEPNTTWYTGRPPSARPTSARPTSARPHTTQEDPNFSRNFNKAKEVAAAAKAERIRKEAERVRKEAERAEAEAERLRKEAEKAAAEAERVRKAEEAKKKCDPYLNDFQITNIVNGINCNRSQILLKYHPDKLINICDEKTVTENYTRIKNKFNSTCKNKIP
jgi:hypothetical protein